MPVSAYINDILLHIKLGKHKKAYIFYLILLVLNINNDAKQHHLTRLIEFWIPKQLRQKEKLLVGDICKFQPSSLPDVPKLIIHEFKSSELSN